MRPALLDVKGNVIGVEALGRRAIDSGESRSEDRLLGFHRADFEREDTVVETVEHIETPTDPLVMRHAGVRQKDKPITELFPGIQERCQWLVRTKDVRARATQVVDRNATAEIRFQRPVELGLGQLAPFKPALQVLAVAKQNVVNAKLRHIEDVEEIVLEKF